MENIRLDKYLKITRLFKQRGKAQLAIEGGKVKVNGNSTKAAKLVKVGDTIQITRDFSSLKVKIVEIVPKQVSAADARLLYEVLEEEKKTSEFNEKKFMEKIWIEQKKENDKAWNNFVKHPDKKQKRMRQAQKYGL